MQAPSPLAPGKETDHLFLPEEVVCALVRGLVFVTTKCQLRVSA